MTALWDLAASACIVAAVVIIHDALEIWTDSAVYDLDGSLIPARLTDRELDALRRTQ